jgi:hypothetical protein
MNRERVTDERLCWLAVRDQLHSKARGGGLVTVLRLFGAGRRRAGMARDVAGEMISERLMDYGVAVDDLASQLDAEERQTLRLTGQVPAWFLPRVEERARQLRQAR